MTHGLILCGGGSTRFGASKATRLVDSVSSIELVCLRLLEATARVLVVAAPNQELPKLPERVVVVRDLVEGLGPLNGFATGIAALPPEVDRVFLTSCDVPFLVPAFVRRVLAELGSHDIAIPVLAGITQPLAAAYRVSGLRERVERSLAEGKRSLKSLLAGADVNAIDAESLREVDPELRSLRSFNTPEEFEALLRDFGPITSVS